jgi:hypothetical protein
MSIGLGNIAVQQKQQPAAAPGGLLTASEGLFVVGTDVQLGTVSGFGPSAADLSTSRDIITNGQALFLIDAFAPTTLRTTLAAGFLQVEDPIHNLDVQLSPGLVTITEQQTNKPTLSFIPLAAGDLWELIDDVGVMTFRNNFLAKVLQLFHTPERLILGSTSDRVTVEPGLIDISDLSGSQPQLNFLGSSVVNSAQILMNNDILEINDGSGNPYLELDIQNSIFWLGDIPGIISNTYFYVDQTSGEINSNSNVVLTYNVGASYLFGATNHGNNTRIMISDSGQRISMQAANGLSVNEAAFLIHAVNALTDGAGGSLGTLGNAPAAGNPTKWIAIDDGGVTRHIPAW